ncbi:2-oxo acid dehydrogenase subunit E2 [Mycobacterium sp. CBMA293]|uniref:dihydrolipoamide acetyltransferase family protein n=1 Tax=unclassified Mycolicibacterium TaxID=2636767 RepID=UPI0012DECD05|nr:MULTISPECIES: dihydrolipoamide acetyltransferase family protein [unclassified Mycolicibacterium]MUL48680.1 2-oxo acid dehydrogenase subunit E2 [Mycolicibacterium sp. CBMA 360]MUL60822.1 2-oxo acid dehydrogenase subunit E2 [Mycolicibacterium sp. CBMA 335]MUL71835.1 2-oxo acid dehydrogenase subunit E2 [Mycolicibacterium sp. CBMA 311]MUL95763.1 2-oxo acid dehydrogenase subunit E2 [Mycolicibacterium sp. CBMA 230]MUM06361.1 branched-chain alpha-keto acid dehydrogenase subunit E2 [Mycolicibacteri
MTETHDFRVPDLGEGLEDATITAWAVAVGDTVELNQVLCTVETNKAAVEIPSPYAGLVAELGGAEGETLAVGAVLVRIAADAAAAAAAAPEPQPAPKADAPQRKPVLVGYGADADLDATRRRPRAKPRVRKLAAELHVDLNGVAPSGPDGIVTRQDVLASAHQPGPADLVPVAGVQAEMARRMSVSRKEIPDAHASVEVDCGELLRVRDLLASADGTVTPFVLTLRLLTIALRHHQELNATWVPAERGASVHLHDSVHLGIGVATPRGLLVPVVRHAERLSTRELAWGIDGLIRSARDGTLKPVELQGSTFTVSNFGALGLDEGVPVINYPEAAILGMGTLKPRAVVRDGEVVARPTMTLTCAFDHRIADGAGVAAFLGELRALIEAPELALLDA